MTGIYIFKNTKEKKCYIGQSSRLEERKYEHYHPKKREKNQFHLDLRENPDDFEYSVIEYCNIEELDDKELYWMDQYKSDGWTLYNKIWRPVNNNRGTSPSEETRKKISVGNKGKCAGENHPMYGKHHSEETKQKISEAGKGNQNAKGSYRSEEYRKKNSESHKGNQYRKGKKTSEETKKKLSDIYKGKHWRINQTTGKREWY